MAASPSPSDRAHVYEGAAPGLAAGPSVVEHILRHSRARADAPFLTAVSPSGEMEHLTYRQLNVLSARTAGWARRELGAGSGRVLGLLPVNDKPSVLAILGLLRTGGAVLVLNPTDPAARMDEQADAIGVDAILRPATLAAEAYPDVIAVPDAETLPDPGAGPEPAIRGAEDALLFGTSGSTSRSKLVAQSHLNAAVNARAAGLHHGLRPGDRLLGCLPVHHVNGMHFTLLATLAAGAHAILAHGFDPFGYPRLLDRFRPRLASVVPSILEALLVTCRAPGLHGGFEHFVTAAAPLAAATAAAVDTRLGARVLQAYGLTETTNFSTTVPRDLPEPAYRRLVVDADIPSIGTAVWGNDVAVLTPEGERAAIGEPGELCMRGHNIMSRYAGEPEATAEAFSGGWFHSQDLGFALRDPDREGMFFVITGRLKNIAKVGGESVSLDEMDRALRLTPGIADAACVALPHRLLGEEVVAAVVMADGAGHVDVRAALRASFATAVLPRRVEIVDAIPRTATGKVRRPELAEQLSGS